MSVEGENARKKADKMLEALHKYNSQILGQFIPMPQILENVVVKDKNIITVSYTHLRAHETREELV